MLISITISNCLMSFRKQSYLEHKHLFLFKKSSKEVLRLDTFRNVSREA